MRSTSILYLTTFFCTLLLTCCENGKNKLSDGPRRIEVLFLGHSGEHHNSARYLPLLSSALSKEGINFTYTEDPADLAVVRLPRIDERVVPDARHQDRRGDEPERGDDQAGRNTHARPVASVTR